MAKTVLHLTWHGDKIMKVTEQAARNGIDETMAAAVTLSKTLVRVRTATLQGSIRFEAARPVKPGVILGRWGSFDVNYAIWQEIGTSKMTGKPYLRPASDVEYPRLVDRIRKWMK